MSLSELIEALDQRYGNPHAKECHLIHKAIAELRKFQQIKEEYVGGLIKDAVEKRSAELKEKK
jgi:hypothetical protein